MREVAGSTPGLDFYILCEPIMFLFVYLCLISIHISCFTVTDALSRFTSRSQQCTGKEEEAELTRLEAV
jgi:hypothetical protein